MAVLRTFELPDSVSGTTVDRILGRQLVRTWETDGIFQVAATPEQDHITRKALTESRRFFARSLPEKAKFVSDLTYSGYIASGEEVTAGQPPQPQIFPGGPRVRPPHPRGPQGGRGARAGPRPAPRERQPRRGALAQG